MSRKLQIWDFGVQPELEYTEIVPNGVAQQEFRGNPIMPKEIKNIFQSYIYPMICRMGGMNRPDYDKAKTNLENSHWENLVYLGTYFPRSALESQSLFLHLLETVPAFRKALSEKSVLKVLDFGCGTGGELIGMLSAFHRVWGEKAPAVEVLAVDGNRDAMNIARRLIVQFAEDIGMNVQLAFWERVVSEEDFLKAQVETCGPFDVIVTSKFLSEVNDMFSEPYRWFAASMMPMLTEEGVGVFMDVTCRQSAARGGQWSGLQMYKELGDFQLEDERFRTLFPIICNGRSCCTNGCQGFPQFVFDFSDLGYPTQTKLACRVMCREKLWRQVRLETEPAEYWLKNTSWARGCCTERGGRGRVAPLPVHCINVPEN